MAFGDYASADDVLKAYRLHMVQGSVVSAATDAPAFSDHFRSELDFNQREFPLGRSEIGAGETVLFPILREVWRPYAEHLCLFSHEPMEYDADLRGIPDYFVCRPSEYGRSIPDTPYLLVVEAKRDDFVRAWGQCLAAMLAAQKLHAAPDMPIHGIATNGKSWEFGVLLGREFTVERRTLALHDLDALGQVLHAVFRACLAAAYARPVAAGAI